MTDLRSWLELYLVSGVGVVLFGRLTKAFGSPREALEASSEELMTVDGVSERLAGEIRTWARGAGPKAAEEEMKAAEEAGVRIVLLADDGYPESLASVYAPPPILYVRGRLPEAGEGCVAIVGTRKATSYGRRVAKRISVDLASAGATIVSGCAQGVDTVAHEACLEADGRTVAVLGSGLGTIAPTARSRLVDRIVERGAVISEFPMKMGSRPENYPRRNRLLSGLSAATIVVEAPEKSGALITASYAVEQGRELFAVPGRVDDLTAQGCNRLIQDGAQVLLGAEDVIAALSKRCPGVRVKASVSSCGAVGDRAYAIRPLPPLSETEAKVYEGLSEEPTHTDALARISGLPVQDLLRCLLSLEMKQVVRRLSGSRYQRG